MGAFLKLEPSGTHDEVNDLILFKLSLYGDVKDDVPEGTWFVNSGAPKKQLLTHYNDPRSYSGDMRPIPEGIYDIGLLEFMGGVFDWKDSWGPGLGDLWVDIKYYAGEYIRKSFGFHLDENRHWAPGSAGCVVFRTKAEAESWVKAMRKYDPKRLYVDYGLGFVELPLLGHPKPPEDPAIWIKEFANEKGFTMIFSRPVEAGQQYRVFKSPGTQTKLVLMKGK